MKVVEEDLWHEYRKKFRYGWVYHHSLSLKSLISLICDHLTTSAVGIKLSSASYDSTMLDLDCFSYQNSSD